VLPQPTLLTVLINPVVPTTGDRINFVFLELATNPIPFLASDNGKGVSAPMMMLGFGGAANDKNCWKMNLLPISKGYSFFSLGGARTMEIGPIRNQNLIFLPVSFDSAQQKKIACPN